MSNVFDKKIATCTCGSDDVFMRKTMDGNIEKFSLKCNFCQRQQEYFNTTWDDAVDTWNKGVLIRPAVEGLHDISMLEFSR